MSERDVEPIHASELRVRRDAIGVVIGAEDMITQVALEVRGDYVAPEWGSPLALCVLESTV